MMANRGTGRFKREPQAVAAALAHGSGLLMRQVRKFAALRACLNEFPPELEGMAAPYDVRQSVTGTQAASSQGAEEAGVSVLYVYAVSPTVQAVLARMAGGLIERVNARLPYPLVQELRVDIASKQKIEQQVNILRAEPD